MSDLMAKCDWHDGTLSVVLPEDPERIAVRMFDSRYAPARLYVPEVETLILRDENAKLRELVRDLWPFVKAGWVHACPNRECRLFEECDADSEYECPIEEHIAGRMRELGVEVDA